MMKTTQMYWLFIFLMGMVWISSCTKTDPNEEINDMLDGKWEATSFVTEDNIERITGEISQNELLFQKDSVDGGLLSWKIKTSLIELNNWSGRYSISNSGTRLNFYDKLFAVEFDGDHLILTGLFAEDPFTIEADRK